MSFANRLPSRATAASALCVLLLTAGCSSTKQSVGIDNVDSLVSRVERVHLEAELSKQTVYDSILKLGPLVAPEFDGDPAEAFAAFALATEECEKQANKLRSHVAPMRGSADTVFKTWSDSLDGFSSPSMRDRSKKRLDATRERFAEVQETAIAAQKAFDAVNARLRDIALFLGHDFNAQSVEEIREDALGVRDEARTLGRQLDECMAAAATYVSKSALRGEVQATVEASRD